MQYSPQCAIPYVSMVDAGTVELVRGLGVEVVSSADLIQHFEARWSAGGARLPFGGGAARGSGAAKAFEMIGERVRGGERSFGIRDHSNSSARDSSGAGLFTDHGPIVGVNANASESALRAVGAGKRSRSGRAISC